MGGLPPKVGSRRRILAVHEWTGFAVHWWTAAAEPGKSRGSTPKPSAAGLQSWSTHRARKSPPMSASPAMNCEPKSRKTRRFSPLMKRKRQPGVSFALIVSGSHNLWNWAPGARGPSTISGFRFTIRGTKRAEICGTGAQFMKLRRSRSPVFRCKDQFGRRFLIQRSPGRLTATWFHKLRLDFPASPRNYVLIPEIVQQESHLFSMSPSPTNYGLPTQASDFRVS